MNPSSTLSSDRAVNFAYMALIPLTVPVIGWLVSPQDDAFLLRAFLAYAAVLLAFYAGLHFVAALWLRSLSDSLRHRMMLSYLPLPLVAWWVSLSEVGMLAVAISLVGWAWAYLAAVGTMSVAPDWLLRIRQRIAWTTAVCHLAALAWLARTEYLAS